jgi:hypothetical protein
MSSNQIGTIGEASRCGPWGLPSRWSAETMADPRSSEVTRDVAAARLARLTDVAGVVAGDDTGTMVEHVVGITSLADRRKAQARLARLEDQMRGHR